MMENLSNWVAFLSLSENIRGKIEFPACNAIKFQGHRISSAESFKR